MYLLSKSENISFILLFHKLQKWPFYNAIFTTTAAALAQFALSKGVKNLNAFLCSQNNRIHRLSHLLFKNIYIKVKINVGGLKVLMIYTLYPWFCKKFSGLGPDWYFKSSRYLTFVHIHIYYTTRLQLTQFQLVVRFRDNMVFLVVPLPLELT